MLSSSNCLNVFTRGKCDEAKCRSFFRATRRLSSYFFSIHIKNTIFVTTFTKHHSLLGHWFCDHLLSQATCNIVTLSASLSSLSSTSQYITSSTLHFLNLLVRFWSPWRLLIVRISSSLSDCGVGIQRPKISIMGKVCRQRRFFGSIQKRSNTDFEGYRLVDVRKPDSKPQGEELRFPLRIMPSTRNVHCLRDVMPGEVFINGLGIYHLGGTTGLQYTPFGALVMNERLLLGDIPSLEPYIHTDKDSGARVLHTTYLDIDILRMVLAWDANNGTVFPHGLSQRDKYLINQKRFAQLYFLAKKLDIPRLQERAKDLFLENFRKEKRAHIPILDFIWINTNHGDVLREGILLLAVEKQETRIGEFNLTSPVTTTQWITPDYIESKFYRGGLKLPSFEPRLEPNTMFKDDFSARVLDQSSSKLDQMYYPLPPSIDHRPISHCYTRKKVSIGAKVRDKLQTLKYVISGRRSRDKKLQEELRLYDKMMIEDEKAHPWDKPQSQI